MKLLGIQFSPVWGASGVQGIFGEGYWFHRLLKPFGLDFTNATFSAKTTTLALNVGRMPLKRDGITPRELFPRCIMVWLREALMLNAVGLSNFGTEFYLKARRWQERTEPFSLSFMPLCESLDAQLTEVTLYCRLLNEYRDGFKAPFCVQINRSCPNIGHDLRALEGGTVAILRRARSILGAVPLIPKFNLLVTPERARGVAECGACDALWISNTVPYGELPARIPWQKLFGSKTVSPMERRFGNGVKGGLSGAPLRPLVCEWIEHARAIGVELPIIAGGGLLEPNDVDLFVQSGASAVSIGSVATLRGWRVSSIIRRAHRLSRGY